MAGLLDDTTEPLLDYLRRHHGELAAQGWSVSFWAETTSTMDRAREAANAGAPNRSLFLADYQTAGRGRLGRSWLAPPGTALLMSLLLRGGALAPFQYTMICALAVAQALERLGLGPAIKWPNDVLIRDYKCAGVLTEVGGPIDDRYVIVGIGLNVNLAASDLPPQATSLARELGRPVGRGPLLATLLISTAALLDKGEGSFDKEVRQPWEARLWRRAQRVRFSDGQHEIEGTVEGVSPQGLLRLRVDGELREFAVGDLLL